MSGHEADLSGDSLLESCRARLAAAEKRYREAIQSHLEVVEEGTDAAAAAAAVERKGIARQEYHRLLREFSDLVVRGKQPRG
jgi:UDP-N-acetylmuramoylalanine-D-glutamate ligase